MEGRRRWWWGRRWWGRWWRVSGGKFFREGVYKGVGGGYSSASSLNAKPTTKTKSEVL
jgi:hypothetical protein